MSILLKGLSMPKKGTCIDIVIFDDGTVVYYDEDDKKIGEAVELPDHGDLIDKTDLMESLADWQLSETPEEGINWDSGRNVTSHELQYSIYRLLGDVYEEVRDEPVVIPAERSGE